MALIHGGDLTSASSEFGITKDQWIDLSTGISPWSWTVPKVPEVVWQSLPNIGDGLEEVAASYYGCNVNSVLPVAGSQEGLQKIPNLLERGRVAIPSRGYAEHRLAWQKAGHEIVDYQTVGQLQQLVFESYVKHAVVINPNNPTGEMIGRQQLMRLQQPLQKEGGWLLVDEAFMDACPENSFVPERPKPGLIVLRSVGKFFGLAGLRLGFVIAPPKFLQRLADQLSPWNVSHPARWIGTQALVDSTWHRVQRQRLTSSGDDWYQILGASFPLLEFSSSPLFVSGAGDAALCEAIYRALGQRGVLVRLFDEIAGQRMIRFGLPHEGHMSKVTMIIQQMTEGQLCANG